VLTIAQLQAGRYELELENVDLAEVAETAMAEFRLSEEGERREIALAVSGTPRVLSADRRAITQMLLKLLSNAAKFSPAASPIRVMLAGESDGWMRLSATDQGVGISAEVADLAVRPFRQVDGRLAREHGGTGLGLSIVNGLIERHGGRPRFVSAANKGST